MITAYLGVGSNIDREKHVRVAIEELALLDTQLKISSIYESAPIGFEGEPFYNFAVELKTTQNLMGFSHQLRQIEVKWGRSKDARKYQDRHLDIDILLFGAEVSESSPVVPREDIFKYPFVIQPLYELCPELVIPNDGRKIEDIWLGMEHFDSLTKVNFIL